MIKQEKNNKYTRMDLSKTTEQEFRGPIGLGSYSVVKSVTCCHFQMHFCMEMMLIHISL